MLQAGALGACALALASCWRDDGVNETPPAQSLADFHGETSFADTSFNMAERVQNLANPKVALVWLFTGMRENRDTYGKSVVSTDRPFNFSGQLFSPPPGDVLSFPEVAIGQFWLYHDGNGNGSLDRLTHPEMKLKNLVVDSLQNIYLALLDSVQAISEIRPPVNEKRTYYMGAYGTLLAPREGRMDTVWKPSRPEEAWYWEHVLGYRQRVMNHLTRWENFFGLRKKVEERTFVFKPVPGYVFEIETYSKRRLYPKPGHEEAFERLLTQASVSRLQALLYYQASQKEAVQKGWVEYPYDGFGQEGEDWVGGRSIRHFVVYLPTQASIDEVVEAERSSSFRFRGLDKIRRGYNLVTCDPQYACEVLDWSTSVEIMLGYKEATFNPPSEPPKPPIAAPGAEFPSAGDLDRFAGAYDYLAHRPVCAVVKDGRLWLSIPGMGLHRMVRGDSNAFYSPLEPIQAQFDPSLQEEMKVIIYFGKTTAIGIRGHTAALESELALAAQAVETAAAREHAGLDSALLGGDSLVFDYRRAPLVVRPDYAGDSLVVRVPGFLAVAHGFRARKGEPAEFFNANGALSFRLERDGRGAVTRLWWTKDGTQSAVPNLAVKPYLPDSLFPGLAFDTGAVASSDGGSASDSLVGLDGGPRYACSEDGRFLRSGDGWIHALRQGAPADQVSLQKGGDAVIFKVQGAAGKKAALKLRVCGEKTLKKGRILAALRGGRDPERLEDILAEAHWVELTAKPSELLYKPLPIPSDPYYIEIGQLPTAEDPFFYAADGYEIRVE